MKDVHTEHCCSRHGCKYGNPACTVTTGKTTQSYPCEYCDTPQKLIVEYWVGDGCTYSATETYPILYESKAKFIAALETHFLIHLDALKVATNSLIYKFDLGGRTWDIQQFISAEWPNYEPIFNPPLIYTVEEWFDKHIKN